MDDTSRFACWRIWVDPERDNQNWQAYYYAGPRLPRVWSAAGPALAGDGNTTFTFSLTESEADSKILLNLTKYGGFTGKLAQPLRYSLQVKPVSRQSDCNAKNFVKPGESLDYIKKTGDINWVSANLINQTLRAPSTYSQKFICFQVVITLKEATWYQIIQSQYQTYYYASERLPGNERPRASATGLKPSPGIIPRSRCDYNRLVKRPTLPPILHPFVSTRLTGQRIATKAFLA